MIARGKRRGFPSAEVFFALGYQCHQAIPIDLSDFPSGTPIYSSTEAPPEGALVLDKNDGRTVWWILDNARQGFESAEVFHTYGFDFSKIVPANDADMSLPAGPLVKFRDGTLVIDKDNNNNNQYYIISDGQKRRFATLSRMLDLGYREENVILGSQGR